jgi:hypothetical protein
VRCDPCGQKPRRRCAMRVRPCPGCQAALGLSARRRRADLQRTDRPCSSVGSWTTSPAAIRMYTNERIQMYTNERIRTSRRVGAGALAASRAACCRTSRGRARSGGRGGASPVRERLFNVGYVKRGGPRRGHGRTGLPCHGLMSGEYSEGEARPWIGSDHWWGFDEPMGAANGRRT